MTRRGGPQLAPGGRPLALSPHQQEEVIRMRPVLTSQQLAQVGNPDPFAPPIWRAPVYHTPGWIIAAVQIARTLWAIARFLARHPAADLAALVLVTAWRLTGWPGPVALVLIAVVALVTWRLRWPASFTRWVRYPAQVAAVALPPSLAGRDDREQARPAA